MLHLKGDDSRLCFEDRKSTVLNFNNQAIRISDPKRVELKIEAMRILAIVTQFLGDARSMPVFGGHWPTRSCIAGGQ
jgi:hypothetical protein